MRGTWEQPAAPPPLTAVRWLGLIAAYAGAGVFATWPLALAPGRTVVGNLGDPILAAVILGWDADRILHALRGLWDAPYLFPYHSTLAYSEHLLGIAPFVAPVAWLSANPVLASNVAQLGSFILAGAGMFLLVRSLSGRSDAAFLAGFAFALTPYRLEAATHLQVLMNGWVPVSLLGLHRYFAAGDRRWLVVFASGFLLAGLSNGYYFFFALVPIGVVVAAEFARPRLTRQRIAADLGLAAVAAAVVVAPVVRVYLTIQHERGFARGQGELETFGARLIDYLHVTPGAWAWGVLTTGAPERNLFPGVVLIGFAALALVLCRSRTVWVYAAAAVLAVWGSMGARGGPVYGWLFGIVPGFNGLRVPARLAAVALVALAVLAGMALSWILQRLAPWPRATAIALVAGVVVLEGRPCVPVVAVPARAGSWDRVAYDWLASSPPGALLELDISGSGEFRPETTTIYQLAALGHRHPIVNGYSGWGSTLQDLLADRVSPLREPEHVADVLKGLRAIGVRYVLLHDRTFVDPADAARLAREIDAARGQIAEQHRFGDVRAWRLAEGDDGGSRSGGGGLEPIPPQSFTLSASHQAERLALAVDGDIDTRWLSGEPQNGSEWIEIRFSAETDVGRVELQNAPRSVFDYPRHLVVEAEGAAGARTVLFDGSVVDRLIAAVAADDQRSPVDIDLPPNRTRVLRLRQTGQTRTWWSIHELRVWRRTGD